MREAMGGSWLLGFVVVFVVLFSSYLAISISYTKAFKVKNKIITIIEENEGYTTATKDLTRLTVDELKRETSTQAKIYLALKDIGYFSSTEVDCDAEDGKKFENSYCVKQIATTNGTYYKVKTFILFRFDLFNLSIQIPINGETKTIYYDRGNIQEV